MKLLIAGISILIAVNSCQNEATTHTENNQSNNAHTEKHWSYNGETGPSHWKELEVNSDCGGKYQSPINIVNYQLDETLAPLNITYSDSTHIHDVVNNGHSIQYNFDAGDYITLDNKRYELKQFHFHEPAEHLIDGVRYPMVLHLVHISDAGEYAVFAVMAKEGVSSSPFDFLESYLPLNVEETKVVDTAFDMNLNLPEDKTYFNYTGSLTTPPCTERVEWFIFKEPITVSLEQVEKLKALMPLNNYRDEQPQNGRVIRVSR
ncbi:carbonic anhydrase family protein [uncultured Dokdonia sp.]|uniref:carbonic anhydrase n=1 Tax=uncultured Dokdonia sp. TaxID=575653 RepID=UPI002601B5FC|nr:carbonic anhydrase family protein [uncultured Dokdonia sp.]